MLIPVVQELAMLADYLRQAATGAGKPRHVDYAELYAAAAAAQAERAKLSPLELAIDLMAVVDRETGARNILGDGGHGHGLGQVDDRFFGAWLAAHQNGLDPASNLQKSAEIYVDSLVLCRRAASRMATPPSEGTIRAAAAAGYNAGASRCSGILEHTGDPEKVDAVTTGKEYGRDVRRRAEAFAAHLPSEAGLVACT